MTLTQEIDINSGKYAQRMANVIKKFTEKFEEIELIKHTINMMGISELSSKFSRLEALILHNYEFPIEEY